MTDKHSDTVHDDPDLLTDDELDAVAGGIVIQNRNMRNMTPGAPLEGGLEQGGIIIENREAIIDDNMPTP
jgi:hypothetical protein